MKKFKLIFKIFIYFYTGYDLCMVEIEPSTPIVKASFFEWLYDIFTFISACSFLLLIFFLVGGPEGYSDVSPPNISETITPEIQQQMVETITPEIQQRMLETEQLIWDLEQILKEKQKYREMYPNDPFSEYE